MFMTMSMKPVQSVSQCGTLYDTYISYRYEKRTIFYHLYHADEQDKLDFPVKKDCTLFRLKGERTGSWPIVCINLQRSLIYFLKDYDGDDAPEWETRGIKLEYPLNNLQMEVPDGNSPVVGESHQT